MSVEFLTNLPLAPKLLPTNLSDSCCRFFFLSFAILGSASGEDIYTMCLLIFWHSAVAEVSTLRTKSLGTISVLSVVTKAAAEEAKQPQKKKRKKHLVCLGEKNAFLEPCCLVGNSGSEWHVADDRRANWPLKSDWSAVERRLVLVCQTNRKQRLLSDVLLPLRFKPTRRQHFAPGSLLLAPPSTSVWSGENGFKSRKPHDAQFPGDRRWVEAAPTL